MDIFHKIHNIYHLYCLCNKDKSKIKKITNLSIGTVNKYIKIQERLDLRLMLCLDSKEINKLTISMASELIQIINPDIQYSIYMDIDKNIKIPKELIKSYRVCNICCI